MRRSHEPEVRWGHCCGCGVDDTLYKIAGIFRYRCAKCFRQETGHFHAFTPTRIVEELLDKEVKGN